MSKIKLAFRRTPPRGTLYCRCLPGPLVRMTLSHHVKDSRLKCAAFAGDACACLYENIQKATAGITPNIDINANLIMTP